MKEWGGLETPFSKAEKTGGSWGSTDEARSGPPGIFQIRELGDNGGDCQKEFISEVEFGE